MTHTDGQQEDPITIPDHLGWDYSILLPQGDAGVAAEQEEILRLATQLNEWETRTDWITFPTVMEQALGQLEYLHRVYAVGGGGELAYFLRTQENTSDTDAAAKLGLCEDYSAQISERIAFVKVRIAELPLDRQKEILASRRLTPYHGALKKWWSENAHLLSVKEETTIERLSPNTSGRWNRMLETITGGVRAKVHPTGKAYSLNELRAMLQDCAPEDRDRVFNAIVRIRKKVAPVAIHWLNNLLALHASEDRVRGRKNPEDMHLVHDQIPSEAVDAMLTAVSESIHLSHLAFRIKAACMGVERMPAHWYSASLRGPDVTTKVSYPEAVTTIYKAFQTLSPEFGRTFKTLVESGRLSPLIGSDKAPGAVCWSTSSQLGSFVSTNFSGRVGDVTDIAHEAGHFAHFEFAFAKQKSLCAGSSTAIAEIASLLCEMHVSSQVLAGLPDEERFALLAERVETLVANVFSAANGFDLERRLHRKYREVGDLDEPTLSAMFLAANQEWMGPWVEHYPGAQLGWTTFTPLANLLYSYSYPFGFLLGLTIAAMVREDPSLIENVISLLEAGISDTPENLLMQHLGIDFRDPEFWKAGMEMVRKEIEAFGKLAYELGKIKEWPLTD